MPRMGGSVSIEYPFWTGYFGQRIYRIKKRGYAMINQTAEERYQNLLLSKPEILMNYPEAEPSEYPTEESFNVYENQPFSNFPPKPPMQSIGEF